MKSNTLSSLLVELAVDTVLLAVYLIVIHTSSWLMKLSWFLHLQHDPTCFTSKAAVFNELWRHSYNSTHCGIRSSSAHTMRNKGYSLQIKGLHQGTYVSHVDVIGDKNAGHTGALINHKPLEWDKVFNRLKSLVNIPFKVILCNTQSF